MKRKTLTKRKKLVTFVKGRPYIKGKKARLFNSKFGHIRIIYCTNDFILKLDNAEYDDGEGFNDLGYQCDVELDKYEEISEDDKIHFPKIIEYGSLPWDKYGKYILQERCYPMEVKKDRKSKRILKEAIDKLEFLSETYRIEDLDYNIVCFVYGKFETRNWLIDKNGKLKILDFGVCI